MNNIKKGKRFIVAVCIVVLFGLGVLLVACGGDYDATRLSTYSIDATLTSDNELRAIERVEYTNNSDIVLERVAFHLYPNAFRRDATYKPYDNSDTGLAMSDDNYGGIEILSVKVSNKSASVDIGGVDKNILSVPISDLQPTRSVEIVIEFVVDIPTINHRFGRVGSTINMGNWYPIAAVLDNGEFREEPYYSLGDPFISDVSNYDISLTVPNKYDIAASGTPIVSASGNNKIYKIKQNNIRDFAFVASDKFERADGEIEGIAINYYYYDDPSYKSNLQIIKDAMATFNSKFGKYPYDSITVVKTGFLHGGMEYPMLVYISDALSDDTYPEVIVHELAHQWWYAAVGNDQIKNAWIDEGLAEYATTIFYEFNTQYGVSSQRRIADTLSNFLLYAELNGYLYGKNTVMAKELSEFASNMEYVFMVYAKGQLLFDTLRTVIGDKAFFAGLQGYYRTGLYRISSKDDLIGAFEASSKRDLDKFFDSWIYGKVQLLG